MLSSRKASPAEDSSEGLSGESDSSSLPGGCASNEDDDEAMPEETSGEEEEGMDCEPSSSSSSAPSLGGSSTHSSPLEHRNSVFLDPNLYSTSGLRNHVCKSIGFFLLGSLYVS